jgi:FAD/FMN-containing dehydrogenase
MSELLARLERAAGQGGLLTGKDVSNRAAGVWNPDGIKAQAIARPGGTRAVAELLRLCCEAGQPVVTHGGLTGLVGGALTEPGDIVISLERMNAIESIDTANRTMTVQAGCTVQAIQKAAEQAGMHFALDFGARGSATIGGALATNAGGNQVIRYGMARDQVLGLEAVLADGTVLSSMNQMIKNNAGYDLKHLFIGSEGTLGVITRAVLRLREAPRSESTALVACASLELVSRLLKHMDAGLGGGLSAFEVMWRDFYVLTTSPPSANSPPLEQSWSHYVLIGAAGGDEQQAQAQFEQVLGEAFERELVADAVIAQSGPDRDALWAIRDDVERTMEHGPVQTFDISLPIPLMQAYTEQVTQRLQQEWGEHLCWIFGHLGDGNLHIVVGVGQDDPQSQQRVERAIYEPLQALGGSVSAEHGIGLEKRPWLHLSRSPAELDAMLRLKQAFDPRGILNPGKVLPGS